ncbi:MAG: hypothetical protein AAB955_01295 [Patescibacteria group bacterium]
MTEKAPEKESIASSVFWAIPRFLWHMAEVQADARIRGGVIGATVGLTTMFPFWLALKAAGVEFTPENTLFDQINSDTALTLMYDASFVLSLLLGCVVVNWMFDKDAETKRVTSAA